MKVWQKILGSVLILAAACLLVACWGKTAVPVPKVETVKNAATGAMEHYITQTFYKQDYAALNIIGGLCAFLAVGAVVAISFGVPIPRKSFWTLVLCSAGSWALRLVMMKLTVDIDKYLWIIELLGIVALVVGGAGFAYGHRDWLEKKLNVDLNNDGKIGGSLVPSPEARKNA